MEKLTVLVVDDDREIVESIAIFLQADGYLVRKAYNGLEAPRTYTLSSLTL